MEAAQASRVRLEIWCIVLRHDIYILYLSRARKCRNKKCRALRQPHPSPGSIVRLFQDGLVEIYPQRGTYVSLINLAHVDEGRFVRSIRESDRTEACGKLTKDDSCLESIWHSKKSAGTIRVTSRCCPLMIGFMLRCFTSVGASAPGRW